MRLSGVGPKEVGSNDEEPLPLQFLCVQSVPAFPSHLMGPLCSQMQKNPNNQTLGGREGVNNGLCTVVPDEASLATRYAHTK